MKAKVSWIVTGLSAGAVALVLARRYREGREQVVAWQAQRRPALDVVACPRCHGALALAAGPAGEGYRCETCRREYPIVEGIAHFIEPEALTGFNKRFAGMYDWFSWGYRAFSKVA